MTCPDCGRRVKLTDDIFPETGVRMYYCKHCEVFYSPDSMCSGGDDDMPECCVACGNPAWPNCMDSCDIMSDD